MKRDKNPKVKQQPHPTKDPKIAGDPNGFLQSYPAWRIARMEFCDPFGWHTVDAETASFVQQKLTSLESMTWGEIIIKAKKHNHTIAKDDLCKEAKARLEELRLDDVDELLSLHLDARARIWGILSKGILTILWWDPEHRVCPSILKHT